MGDGEAVSWMSETGYAEQAGALVGEREIRVDARVAWGLVLASPNGRTMFPGLKDEFLAVSVDVTSDLVSGTIDYPAGLPEWVRADLVEIGRVALASTESVAVSSSNPALRSLVAMTSGDLAAMVLPGMGDGLVLSLSREEAVLVLADVLRRYQEAGQAWSAVRHDNGAAIVSLSSRGNALTLQVGEGREQPETAEAALALLLGG